MPVKKRISYPQRLVVLLGYMNGLSMIYLLSARLKGKKLPVGRIHQVCGHFCIKHMLKSQLVLVDDTGLFTIPEGVKIRRSALPGTIHADFHNHIRFQNLPSKIGSVHFSAENRFNQGVQLRESKFRRKKIRGNW